MSISIHEQKKRLSPEKFSTFLQEKGKVYWWEKGGFWLITDYTIAKSLLTNSKLSCDRKPFFLSNMPNVNLSLLPDFFNVVSSMMVMSDDNSHKNKRRICYQGFSQSVIKNMIPRIHSQVESILNPLKKNQTIDFINHFANPIPIKTLADFFDINEEDRQNLAMHAKTMTAFFGGGVIYDDASAKVANNAAKTLYDYFNHLCSLRKKHKGDDFLSCLITHQVHFGLSTDEIISQAIMMWVAGMITTSDQMANNCFTLLNSHPEVIADKPSFENYEKIIGECSRLNPAVTFTFRLARENFEIENKNIKVGHPVFISNHAINRDKTFFETPNRINIHHQAHEFSFGFGSHYCLGAKLAKIMMQVTLHALFNSFPQSQLADYQKNHYSLSFSGFHSLKMLLK